MTNGDERLRRAYTSLAETTSFTDACPDSGLLWATAKGDAAPEDARVVVLHCAACAACGAMLRLAREIGAEETASARSAGWVWWLSPLAASLLIVLAAVWLLTRDAGKPWEHIEIAKAAVVQTTPEDETLWRGDEDRSSFREGMEAYARDDFARAAALLGRSAGADASFYRGVSLLLLGRNAEAIPALEDAEAQSSGTLRQEVLWYLARACLKAGDFEKARDALDRLIQEGGEHREAAVRLRREIDGAR